jgi:hypothetical protein
VSGSSLVIAVTVDEKSISTSSITVLPSNDTVNARPDGYVLPEPSRSPTATAWPLCTCGVSPCSATTSTMVPCVKATSTVFHSRALLAAMTGSVPRKAYTRTVEPDFTPKIEPCAAFFAATGLNEMFSLALRLRTDGPSPALLPRCVGPRRRSTSVSRRADGNRDVRFRLPVHTSAR